MKVKALAEELPQANAIDCLLEFSVNISTISQTHQNIPT